MTPESVLKLLTVLLGFSVALECAVVSGLWPLPVPAYHLIHLMLMVTAIAATLALYRRRSRGGDADRAVPLWFAGGLAFTAVGDYVNSALSDVNPVTHKLSWALLLFAFGYTCYIVGMWKGLALLDGGKTVVPVFLWGLIPVILVGNLFTWFTRVQVRVADYPILSYGSFLFNATLYVLLPWLAIRYLFARRFSVEAVVVMVGVVFLAYSDLVLFDSWLKLPAGADIPTLLYASNWILYFGGQCLTNVFPASVALALRGASPGRAEDYSDATL